MSSRNRPRAHHHQDADEERRLWSQIKADAKKVDSLVAKSAAIGLEIAEIEREQGLLLDADKPSDAALDDRLETLYRENVRLSENVQHIIEGKSDDMNLLDSIRILQGLREASEESSQILSQSTSGGRGASKQRNSLGVSKRKAGSMGHNDSADGDETPIPTPSPHVNGSGGRLAAGSQGYDRQRGSSAQPTYNASNTSTREVSVKLEDGAESVTSNGTSVDNAPSIGSAAAAFTAHNDSASSNGAASSVPPSRRLTLSLGAMVFYRNKVRAANAQEGEGMGILCRVTNVIGEGKQRRYEIQDADPDPAQSEDGSGGGADAAPYRASVSHLVPIPMTNAGLSDLGRGRQVLAQYPDTTTFYRAEVSTPWRAKDIGNERGDMVRLKFEGETEDTKETEVERRLVICERER